ncbi:hypothetical protein Nepgr_007835 [Nepenthes gracilis]|uniref:Uncharacterized protein n=1 Tax=Nepenthes gracilis TaxID=150966 RepID=A0AAD3S7L5_NEPGR|nr:hypothetical protein Nepgr_007835 [Nepenthes gracilis]
MTNKYGINLNNVQQACQGKASAHGNSNNKRHPASTGHTSSSPATIPYPNAASALMQDCINKAKKQQHLISASSVNQLLSKLPGSWTSAPIPQLTSHDYQANWNLHLQQRHQWSTKTTTTCCTKLHANQP